MLSLFWFNIIYSKNSPSSTGGRWIEKKHVKNRKEHLFFDAIHGIIETVDKIKDKKRTVFMEKRDWDGKGRIFQKKWKKAGKGTA